ncbi:MAG: glycosyltransferase family 2 protein [Clostridia bacterium]|nr:glycosyltransferase family 2 protein [Clostridia bacterium]
MKCGIVILNYNSYNLTCELVKKCLEIDLIEKIVLVDNDSKDDFDSFVLETNNSRIEYIKNDKNSGYAAGNNIGLKYLYNLGYKYAFIANPDVIFDYNTINEILTFLSENSSYGIVSSVRTQNRTKDTGQFWSIPKYRDALFESIFIGRKFQNKLNKKKSNYICDNLGDKRYIDVEVVGGAFFGCNLDIMNEIDYLDEGTFLWYEENIVSFKLREKGYKVSVLNTCEYEHSHSKKRHGNLMHTTFIKSKKYYCYKYLKIGIFRKILLAIFDFIGIVENKIICFLYKERNKR